MSGSSGVPLSDQLGQALQAFEAGRFDDAATGFHAVLTRDANSAEALYFLGAIHYQQGRHDDALPFAERAAAIRPDSEDCHNLLGLVLIALERPHDAVSALSRAASCNPGFPDAHNNLGAANEAIGELEAAAACYGQTTVVDPGYAQGFANRARILLATGRPAEPEEACWAALSLRADLPDTRYNLAVAQERQGKSDEALRTVEAAL